MAAPAAPLGEVTPGPDSAAGGAPLGPAGGAALGAAPASLAGRNPSVGPATNARNSGPATARNDAPHPGRNEAPASVRNDAAAARNSDEPVPVNRSGSADHLAAAGEPALDLTFDEDALFTLRSAVAAHALDLGGASAVDDMVLVAHELSSNAVRHGGGTGRLRLWRSGERLFCRVTDSGPGLSHPRDAGIVRPAPSIPGGRGLWIARQLAEVRIETGPDGTDITIAIRLPDEPP